MHRAIIAMTLLPGLTLADICQWTDADGRHFAATAPPGVQAQCAATGGAKPQPEQAPDPAEDTVSDRRKIMRWRQQAELWYRSGDPRLRDLAQQLDEQTDNYERATNEVERARAERIDVDREFDDFLARGKKTSGPGRRSSPRF